MAAGDITAKRSKYADFLCNVFDGVDDYVDVAHNANQLGANLLKGFTISAWINPKSIGETAGTVISKSTGTAQENGFGVYFGGENRISIKINNGTVKSSALNSITYYVWNHILITVSAAQLANIYVNGVLSGTADGDLVQQISTITTTNATRIGNRAGATDRSFSGGIAKVKMWDRVLTAAEIAQDYAGKEVGGTIINVPLGGSYNGATNSESLPTTTIENKVSTQVNLINLPAATDKIIVLPLEGRDSDFTIISATRE